MTSRDQLLAEIETFLLESHMTATAFGERCVNDPTLLTRLRRGSDVTLGTADKLRTFMRDWRISACPKPKKRTSRATA